MNSIIAACEPHAGMASVVASACLLGGPGCHIEGFAVLPLQAEVIAMGHVGAAPVLISPEVDARQLAEARTTFEGLMRARAGGGLPHGWHDNEDRTEFGFAAAARVFDAVVVGRPVKGEVRPRLATLEAALFEGGRPLLIAPPKAPERLGETILIAWNGSTESARAVALAMPLLARAKAVIVLSVLDASVPGPTGAMLGRGLARAGITAEIVDIKLSGSHAGPDIAAEAERRGADLIVKGAYTTSRLRQMIFGGATNHLIWNAEVPVLMAN